MTEAGPARPRRPRRVDEADRERRRRRPSTAARRDRSDGPRRARRRKRERDEYLELAQRTRADFDNYRKRVAKETAEAAARGKAELARELIPVVDNLERALEAADDGCRGPPRLSPRAWRWCSDELRAALERAGVESYDPTGEQFDPELHEALSTRADEGTEPGWCSRRSTAATG